MEKLAGKEIAGKFPAIGGDGNAERFALRLVPDGVYRVDGRVIPVCDNAVLSVNDSQPVVSVHNSKNVGIGLLGSQLGVNVKE